MPRTDVVILGGGPAGSAAAITCAALNLRVTLLERTNFPRYAVGESLHPNVEPILQRLGVGRAVRSAGFLRHPGEVVAWNGPEVFEPFAADEAARKQGMQAWRAEFDAILLDRARALGVAVRQPAEATGPILSGGRVVGVETPDGPILSRFTIDATGPRQVLAKWMRLPNQRHSAQRYAWSGLVTGECPDRDACPALRGDEHGWTWVARVRESTYAWTRYDSQNRPPAAGWLPAELRGTTPAGPTQRHDVTWRLASRPAGRGYYLVGAAAAVLDPASSHGVLDALMSGILAGDLIAKTLHNTLTAEQAAARYAQTLRAWFHHDVDRLSEFYGRLAPHPEAHFLPALGQGCFPGA